MGGPVDMEIRGYATYVIVDPVHISRFSVWKRERDSSLKARTIVQANNFMGVVYYVGVPFARTR